LLIANSQWPHNKEQRTKNNEFLICDQLVDSSKWRGNKEQETTNTQIFASDGATPSDPATVYWQTAKSQRLNKQRTTNKKQGTTNHGVILALFWRYWRY